MQYTARSTQRKAQCSRCYCYCARVVSPSLSICCTLSLLPLRGLFYWISSLFHFFYTLPLGIDIFDVLIPIQPSKYDFKIISVAFFCTIRRVFYLNIFHILILFYEIYNFFFKFSTRSSTVYPSGTVSCLFSWEWFLKFLKAAVIDSPPVRKFFTINLRCLPVRSTSKYRKFK